MSKLYALLIIALNVAGYGRATAGGFNPTPAPQRGDTAGCPSVEVLSQGPADAHSRGYYLTDPKMKIDPAKLERKLNAINGLKGKLEDPEAWNDANNAMATLWGMHCAYWQDAGIANLLERARTLYAQITGIDRETSKALHLLLVPPGVAKSQWDTVCKPNEAWPIVAEPDRSALIFAMGGCYGGEPIHAQSYLWTALDQGATHQVGAAAAVIACSYGRRYFTWRICEADAATITPDALAKDLDAIHAPPYARFLMLGRYQMALNRLAARANEMAELEKNYPADKALFDAVYKQVGEHYVPMFAKWGKQLAELDAWESGLRRGPGNAGDCVPKWTTTLQSYVDSVVPKANKDALLAALKDPIGHRFTHALAVCLDAKGDGDSAAMIDSLAGGETVIGIHDAVGDLLRRNGVGGKYQGVALHDQQPDLDYYLYEPGVRLENTRRVTEHESTVASVTTVGDKQRIAFVHKSERQWANNMCEVDYKTVVGIDDYGNFRYAMRNCKAVYENVNLTPSPLLVPRGSAGPVAKGLRVGKSYDTPHADDEKVDQPGRVAWIRRGLDVIWVAGGIVAR